MSERKAREFWIGCHGFNRFLTAFESQEAYDAFIKNTPAIRAREVLPDEASELDRLRKEHTIMKEAILEILNECECTELCTCSYTNKVTARECLAKLGGKE